MKKEHCDELNVILASKPHILEKYGILTIALTLSLLGIIVSQCNYIEYIEASFLSTVKRNGKTYFKVTLENYNDVSRFIDNGFIIECDQQRIVCKGLDGKQYTNNAELFFIPVCLSDTTSMLRMINANKFDLIFSQSYYQIIFK